MAPLPPSEAAPAPPQAAAAAPRAFCWRSKAGFIFCLRRGGGYGGEKNQIFAQGGGGERSKKSDACVEKKSGSRACASLCSSPYPLLSLQQLAHPPPPEDACVKVRALV